MESTKLRFSLLIVFLMMLSIDNQTLIAQNNPVNIEGEGGSYKKQFHSNGKISTEVFAPKDIGNSAKGYAKAWDTKGELIYEKQTSCSGLVNSVRFTYFENGAVMKAEYSLHPDGGIQLNKEITSFNENGQITEIKTMSHDDQITAPYPKFPPKPVIPGVTQTPIAL